MKTLKKTESVRQDHQVGMLLKEQTKYRIKIQIMESKKV